MYGTPGNTRGESADEYYHRVAREIQISPSAPYVPPVKEVDKPENVKLESKITPPATIRKWLNEHGYPTGVRGRLSSEQLAIYYTKRDNPCHPMRT